MPGTTRYSATFDRPYEEEDEEDLPAVPPLTRRSRSASWQATTANGRPYTPLGGSRGSHVRSASTDNGPQASSTSTSPAHSTERIPTRTTGKVGAKTSHNPFQFVKVGQCSLYRKAEEQLKKTQKVKQPEALKEEEEEWQTNLDSWKSRRRKMSQDVFRRQEEMKELLQMEEQEPVAQQKKVKTFSEMVEERANKGRTLSLCLFSNPLGLDEWNPPDGFKDDSEMSCNDTHQSSEESSNANSEDESDVFHNTQTTERNGVKNVNNTQRTRRTGAVHFLGNLNGVNNGIPSSTEENGSNCDFKVSDLTLNGETLSHKCEPCQTGAYNDSGLDSLSSSHRAGDIPDSGSDFSQDSGSSLDCDSPGITGIPTSGTELLEEFSSKDVHPSNGTIHHKEKIEGMELCLKLTLDDGKSQQYGFTINGGKDKGSPVTVASVINGSISDLVGLKTGDHILAINKEDITSLSHSAVISSLKQSAENRQLELLVWRPVPANVKQEKPTVNGSSTTAAVTENPSKKTAPEQTTNKQITNKTNSKVAKVSSVPESSVDNRVDIFDSQSSNKKAAPVKQKDVSSKTPTSTKSQTQEKSSTVEPTKSNADTAACSAENQHGKTVESENEMFVDDFHSAPVSSSSKIPVVEKSPKVMGKKIPKAPQESKKNKSPVNDTAKSDENTRKATGSAVEDVKDNSLNIIYQSQTSVPKADTNAKELVSVDSEHSVSSSADKKVVTESPKSPAQASTNKQEPKFNEKLTFETSEILPVDKVAEQMERLILQQLEEEEQLKEKSLNSEASLHGSVVTTTANVLSEHELSSIDTPPRQVEPPKEKPPPPPTSSSSTNKDSPLKRVNSTKRIKKEIQKRRSDFLGIEKPEEEESTIPPPPDLENILKLECEQERKVREMLGKESLHQREPSFEEEEIARKEREIIENLETEERLKMAKQTVKDESMSSPGDASLSQTEAERIRKLQEERVRMEEERFMKEEQRIRLEEERQLREREEQIRREEAPKPGDLSAALTQSPCPSVGNITQSENSGSKTEKHRDISVGTSNAQTTFKATKDDSVSKGTTTAPVLATSPQIQANEINKRPNLVKKRNKQENKKAKPDKQNIISKNDNKASTKLELQEQTNQVLQPSCAQSKISGTIPSVEVKNAGISKSSNTSQNAEENKATDPQAEDVKPNMFVSEQKHKTPEACKNLQQNKQAPVQSENVKDKKCDFQQKSKEVVPDVISAEISKSSDVSQNAEENKATTNQTKDMKSEELVSKQKPKTPEASKNLQQNKQQTSLQSENLKNKKCAFEQKPKVIVPEIDSVVSKSDISRNAEVNKAIPSETDNVKTDVPVSKQKPKTPEAFINLQQNKQTSLESENSKTKKCASEQKSEEVAPDPKRVEVSKSCNISQNAENKATAHQTGDVKPDLPVSEQKPKTPEVSKNLQQNKKISLEKGNVKTKKCASEQKFKEIMPNLKSAEVPKSSNVSHNVEENKVTTPQTKDAKPDMPVSEQKLKTPEASKNLQQNKQTSLEDETVKNKKCPFEQKSKEVAPDPKRVEVSKSCNISQNAEENKATAPQTEDAKPDMPVSERKPKTPEASKNLQQKKQTSVEIGNVKNKKFTSEQKSKEITLGLKSEEASESSDISHNSEENKVTTPHAKDAKLDMPVSEQKPKTPEASKNLQQNKQTSLENETVKNKKCPFEQKSKEVVPDPKRVEVSKLCNISQNAEENKATARQTEDAKPDMPVLEQKPKTPEASKNLQQKKQTSLESGNLKNKKFTSEQKSKEITLGLKSEDASKSDISQKAEENNITAPQTEDEKSDMPVSEPKPKMSETSKIIQQNKQTSVENESVKNRKCTSEQDSPETLKSFDVLQNAEESKAIAPQTSDAKSSVSVPKRKHKTSDVSKNSQKDQQNLQQDKQTSLQCENVKNKKCTFEQKSKDLNDTQNTKPNKSTLSRKGSLKSAPVPKQESEILDASPSTKQASQQRGDIKTKVLVSKHLSPGFEVFQNAELQQKTSAVPCSSGTISKKWPPGQESKVSETSQNSDVQTVGNSIKTCAPETQSKDIKISPIAEQNKTTSQNVSSKSKSSSSSEGEVSQVMLSAEQNVTSSQTEHLKIHTPEQKSKIPPNAEQKTETLGFSKSIPVQKPQVSDTPQNISLVKSSSSEVCCSELSSKIVPVAQNTELSIDATPQVEATKTDKYVSEQKITGNIVRVRKKKKGIPPKPLSLENSGGDSGCPDSPNKTGKSPASPKKTGKCPASPNKTSKCPASPTICAKPEDQTVPTEHDLKNQENSPGFCVGAKTADTSCETKKDTVSSQNDDVRPVIQKSYSANGVSSIMSTVMGVNADCKTSINAKVDSASDTSATASSTVLSTNSEKIALVSPICSSVSNDASLSQTGGGKNKDAACMPSASGDQSSIAKETANNLVPTKPLKKKEVIRKERERLRQEQEALQRERDEYRRQMMKEQEILKESQKPHAPDAPVSRVGAPPPLKPALPLPLTSLPHASQALKENVIYTSRSPPANSVSAAVGNHTAVSQNPSLLNPSHNAAARPKVTQNDARGSQKVPVKKQVDSSSESRYNQNHWLIQEAEMRRISEQKERQRVHPSGDPRCASSAFNQGQYHPMHIAEENYCGAMPGALQKPPMVPGAPSLLSKPPSNYPVPTQMHSPEQQWNYGQPVHPTPQSRKLPVSNVLSPGTEKIQPPVFPRSGRVDPSLQAPTKPSRVIPMDRQEHMLSVSGRKRCSHCGEELGRGAAMIIESLQLYYHIQCFRCCVCQAQLGNGSCGTDVRVRNNKLHCHNCYSNDEAGLKFSQV